MNAIWLSATIATPTSRRTRVWEKAVGCVKAKTAIVGPARLARMVRGLKSNAVGLMDEKGKKRLVGVSTFSGEPDGK